MYLILAALCFTAAHVINYCASLTEISHLHLSQLTICDVGSFIFWFLAWCFTVGCGVKFFIGSVLKDKIWPWRWTMSYFFVLVFKTVSSICLIYLTCWMVEILTKDKKSSLLAIGSVMILAIFLEIYLLVLKENDFYKFISEHKLSKSELLNEIKVFSSFMFKALCIIMIVYLIIGILAGPFFLLKLLHISINQNIFSIIFSLWFCISLGPIWIFRKKIAFVIGWIVKRIKFFAI